MPEISESRYVVQAEAFGAHWHRADRSKNCIACGEEKSISEFYSYGYKTRQGKQGTRYESRCKPCARIRRRKQYQDTRPHQIKTMAKYRKRTFAARAAYNKRRQSNPEVRALKAYHQRLRKARLRGDGTDDDQIRAIYREAFEIEQIVACCPVFDLPEIGKKMHVDHIIPLSRGGKHAAENLQILPIGLNMRKGVSMPEGNGG